MGCHLYSPIPNDGNKMVQRLNDKYEFWTNLNLPFSSARMLKKSFKTFDNHVIAHLRGGLISGITITWETHNHLPCRSYLDLKTSSSQPWNFILHHLPTWTDYYAVWMCIESCRHVLLTSLADSISMIGYGTYRNFWEERLNPRGKRVWGTSDLVTGRNQLASKAEGLNRYLAL